jgi:flagellar hook assembly protein FlgD
VDVLGRIIRTLADGRTEAGTRTVRWDGMDDTGIPVPSGLYFAKLTSSGSSAVRKMTVIR